MIKTYCFTPIRGYSTHAEAETDSDTDGGNAAKLPGRGHIEFSRNGIPHAILHFFEQLKSAGHIYMHDVCAPEATHRENIKKAMDRVRKGTELQTSASMINWQFRVRTWKRCIDEVKKDDVVVRRQIRNPSQTDLRILTAAAKRVHTSFPLGEGGDVLISNHVRLSYFEMATYISRSMGWDIDHVQNHVRVDCFYSSMVVQPNGEKKTFWSTDTEHPYNEGVRRDMIQVGFMIYLYDDQYMTTNI